MLEQTHDYKSIFLNNAPLLDTRAPIEFIQGSFPTASNLPLMNDEERAAVGTCYKNKGQEAPLEERIERVLKDYVIDLQQEFILVEGEEKGQEAFAEHLLSSLDRITKRLGMERYQQLYNLMQAALSQIDFNTSLSIHREWISQLLESYYDPMYRYQREKKSGQIIFEGTAKAVTEFLSSN